MLWLSLHSFFCYTHPAPTEIYTLSLHDALPICQLCEGTCRCWAVEDRWCARTRSPPVPGLNTSGSPSAPSGKPSPRPDRKSTRLNSSHLGISYAVFCLKKKKKKTVKHRYSYTTH